jgi:hypothetical protein
LGSTITQLITFAIVFVTLLGLFGAATGTIPDVSSTMDAITGNWPVVGTANCSFSQAGPTGSCSVLDTGILGAIWVFASIGSLFYRVGAALFLIVQISSIFTLIFQIPVVGPILGVLGPILLAIYGYSMIRGKHSEI